MRALDRKLWRELARLKGQALAIGILVTCAIGVYVAARATYDALERSQQAYYERNRFAQIFADLRRAPEQLAREIREIPGVSEAQTGVAADVALELPGLDEPATARLVGLVPDASLNRIHLRAGRDLDPEAGDEALVGESFAEAHSLALGSRLTVIVNGRRQSVKVVGIALSPEYVLALRAGDLMPDDRHYAILWMSRAALAPAVDLSGAFNQVSLTLGPGASAEQVRADLDRLLAPYGGQPSYGRERHTSHQFVSDELRGLEAMALAVPAIFLCVAAFLLGIVFSRLIATQRQQIGTLKALGYSDHAIALHYLELAALITAGGIVVGGALGWWMGSQLTQLYASYYRFPVMLYGAQPAVLAQAALLGLAACLVGAGTAVRRAMRLPPAAAMLPEAPAKFRASLLERCGLDRLLGTAGRMTLRNLSRRPLRSALSAMGIAAAVGLLVVGFFFSDAFDALLSMTFEVAQREDLTVALTTPMPREALLELERQPGVIDAEPFRAVPVALRRGGRSWRTALTALEPDARIHRIVDAEGRIVAPPPAGVLLSERLAGILGVRPGETVLAEVLEGRRRTLELPVSATLDDLLGVSAYMALPALNERMDEGDLVSGAFMTVDSLSQKALFARLRGMPKVAGVTQQQAALASFRKAFGEMILLMAGVLVAFATAIAAGIVYNSGRIALAERERELATLRVLGFTRFEAWRVLAGEILVYLALGIPCGFLFGWGLVLVSIGIFDSDLFRMPAVLAPSTWVLSALIVAGSAAAVMAAVLRWLGRLDLVCALKSRE